MTKQLDELLKKNPKAKRDEKLIRDVLEDLAQLTDAGITGEGYRLIMPFSGKKLNPAAGLKRVVSSKPNSK